MDILERAENYKLDYSWQYHMRLQTLNEDLQAHGLDQEQIEQMKVSDFRFTPIESKQDRAEAKKFIERYEWLGNLSQYTTHWFGTYYGDLLAGVVLMNVPNAFSKLMGEDTDKLERLISRGACISWSPKNLASNLIMQSITWMAHNTEFRLFTAYADPTAKELGTIYQACNFYYLGQGSGTTKRYINPYTDKLVSDRFFRQRSAYKHYAKDYGIPWDKSWASNTGMLWENVPPEIEKKLRARARAMQENSAYYEFPPKHKYAYIMGEDKGETKRLRKKFLERNKVYPYPKER